MSDKLRWIFVDDMAPEAQAYAAQLSAGDTPIQVDVMAPLEAKEQLLTGRMTPRGVLMDVDLSGAQGEHGSGPGIAQDIRVKQRAGEIKEFPVVRFAGRAPVLKNVQGDSTSDDLFDIKIPKEDLAQQGAGSIRSALEGLCSVYEELGRSRSDDVVVPELVGLPRDEWSQLGHSGFEDRMLSSLHVATHVAARIFLQTFLTRSGLLIDERMLSVRLGVDVKKSGEHWNGLLEILGYRYTGVGGTFFSRWWARGLDEWWFKNFPDSGPLSSISADERVRLLNEKLGGHLVPLVMSHGSAGARPWRLCSLCLEESPPRFLPIDPSESVRLTPDVDLPPWVDPLYASFGEAIRVKDFRLNRADIERLKRKHR